METQSEPTSSRPSSSEEGSSENIANDIQFPASLASEELQLALNKGASKEELEEAIDKCKNLILGSQECSDERKWLVRHLIELRLRVQEYKDAMTDPLHPKNNCGVSKRVIKLHHLTLQPLLRNASSRYCDHCTGAIWSFVQTWYECEDCGFACHHKCLSSIHRECAYVLASERGAFEWDICPEFGLSTQKYCCYECKTPFCMNRDWREIRRCDYSGKYYCADCHWNSSAIIPARVIHNWDFTPRPVCQLTIQLLRISSNNAYINMEELNPNLFTYVHELDLVRRLKKQLHSMKQYLILCRNVQMDKLKHKINISPHWIEKPHMYSLQDLVDCQSGELPSKLHKIVDIFMEHIKVKCELCKGRGHLCEICSNDEVIYPFDLNVHICSECHAVLHQSCFTRKNECPKCKRLALRKNLQSNDSDE